jgi:FMN reductase (NADPH)
METLDNLFRHRSMRSYHDTPIEEAVLDKILMAGTRASTTGNMQVYSMIVTRDPENKKKLWEYHFKQDMILQAPVLITFCADFYRFNQWCLQRKAIPGYDNFLSFFTAAIDALLVSQNVVVAAEELGLGICYLGTTTYMADKITEFLGLPEGVVPITTLTLGYPDEEPGLTDRLPLEGVVHQEKYHPYRPEDINRIYGEKESMPLTAKLLEENQMETLAQIFAHRRYAKKDNVYFSGKFLEVIRRQGFMNNEE